jgi:hypothetical protein
MRTAGVAGLRRRSPCGRCVDVSAMEASSNSCRSVRVWAHDRPWSLGMATFDEVYSRVRHLLSIERILRSVEVGNTDVLSAGRGLEASSRLRLRNGCCEHHAAANSSPVGRALATALTVGILLARCRNTAARLLVFVCGSVTLFTTALRYHNGSTISLPWSCKLGDNGVP